MNEKEIREFYWKAMAKRWSSGTKTETGSVVPGHKMFVFRKGDYFLAETYCENSLTNGLSGMINIFKDEEPIWTFHYLGFCEKQAKSFLNNVLSKAFRNGTSLGARGPERFEGKKYVYINPRQFGFRIDQVEGYEKIIKPQIEETNDRTMAHLRFYGGFIEKINSRHNC